MATYAEGKPMGPNVKSPVLEHMATIAIPAGSGKDSFAVGLEALLNPERQRQINREAVAQVDRALAAVKAAPDNRWGDDDEAIAAEVLRRVEERKAQKQRDSRAH